jgi:hypothetical protein
MICSNCGKEMPEGKAFCGYCGTKFPVEKPVAAVEATPEIVEPAKIEPQVEVAEEIESTETVDCPVCGALNPPGARFCNSCAAPLATAKREDAIQQVETEIKSPGIPRIIGDIPAGIIAGLLAIFGSWTLIAFSFFVEDTLIAISLAALCLSYWGFLTLRESLPTSWAGKWRVIDQILSGLLIGSAPVRQIQHYLRFDYLSIHYVVEMVGILALSAWNIIAARKGWWRRRFWIGLLIFVMTALLESIGG